MTAGAGSQAAFNLGAPDSDYSGPDNFQWNASDGHVYAAAAATMNITVEPTAAAGTDGNTLASGDEAFQRAVDAGIDAVDQALTGSPDGSGTLDTLPIGTFTPLAEEGCGFSPNLDCTTVPTSQSYSGTLPVNVTVSNPGGGYTISDSVAATYSMQVSGNSTSGTFTLTVSIQATTGYNESENAAGAATPWTIAEPGSYQLSFQSGGSYAVVGGVVAYSGTYTSQESGSNYPVTDENGTQTNSTSSDTWTWHDPGQTSFTSNESAGLGGAGASGTYSSSENSSDTPAYSETDTSDTPDDATDWSGSDMDNSTFKEGGQSQYNYSDKGSFTPAGSTGTYQLSQSDNEKYTVTDNDSVDENYADGAGTTETDTSTSTDPGSGYDNFSYNIIMKYNPSGFTGLYNTNDGGGGEDDYSGTGSDGDNYSSSTTADGITVPWQATCDTNSNSSYIEAGMINPAGDTGTFQMTDGCTATITLTDSVNFTGSYQPVNDTQTDTSTYTETDHETQPQTYTESCVFGPNGCSGTYKSSDPVVWHDTYSGSDKFNNTWQNTTEPFVACMYANSGTLTDGDSYSGSDDDYPSDSDKGSFTQAGSTGLSNDSETWDGTETYNASSSDSYSGSDGKGDTASGNGSYTDANTFNYNGDDCDADNYCAHGGRGYADRLRRSGKQHRHLQYAGRRPVELPGGQHFRQREHHHDGQQRPAVARQWGRRPDGLDHHHVRFGRRHDERHCGRDRHRHVQCVRLKRHGPDLSLGCGDAADEDHRRLLQRQLRRLDPHDGHDRHAALDADHDAGRRRRAFGGQDPDPVGIAADGRNDGAAGPHATDLRHGRGDRRLHGRGRRRERPKRRRGLRRHHRAGARSTRRAG